MIVQGSHVFAGSVAQVWAMLLDPEVIATTTPGAREMRRVAPERYVGKMQLGLGPFTAEFDLEVALTDVVAPERYTMTIRGRGRVATLNGHVVLRLAPDEAAAAVLRYEGGFEVGGAAAALGHRVLEPVGQMLARQGLESLSRELERRLGARG